MAKRETDEHLLSGIIQRALQTIGDYEDTRCDCTEEYAEAAVLEGLRTECFRAAGVLTNNAGFVVTLADGSEYQITIVRSTLPTRS
jgi:hypothetical protein